MAELFKKFFLIKYDGIFKTKLVCSDKCASFPLNVDTTNNLIC